MWEKYFEAAVHIDGYLSGNYSFFGRGMWAWQIFDKEKDRTETKDFSGRHPEILAAMKSRWEQMANITKVYLLPESK